MWKHFENYTVLKKKIGYLYYFAEWKLFRANEECIAVWKQEKPEGLSNPFGEIHILEAF